MRQYRNHSIKEYARALAQREPIPGGGSAAALTAALAVSLVMMAALYSKGKTGSSSNEEKLRQIIKESRRNQSRLLELVDLDAVSYLNVVKARKLKESARKKARQQARKVPLEICRLCLRTVEMTSFLVKKGNPNLLSDVEVALEFLLAAFRSARIMAVINQ